MSHSHGVALNVFIVKYLHNGVAIVWRQNKFSCVVMQDALNGI